MTLREHITSLLAGMDLRLQQRFEAQNEALNAALRSAKEETSKAETAAEKRFELLNELRGDVATKTEVQALEKVVTDLKERLDRYEGRSTGLNAGWGYLVGAFSLIIAVVSFIIR